MNLIVEIPDEIAGSLSSGGDLSRRVDLAEAFERTGQPEHHH